MPKAERSVSRPRHDPLHVDLHNGYGSLATETKKKLARSQRRTEDDEREAFVDSKMSRKILALAQEQQRELQDELGSGEMKQEYANEFQVDQEDGYEDYTSDEEYAEYEELELDGLDEELEPEQEAMFEQSETLADKIMAKIKEKQMLEAGGSMPISRPTDDDGPPEGVMLPPKVIEVYSRVGDLLSRYRDGKMPKVFKMIPSLKRWQDVLYVTSPETWSNQAVYQATKLFVSNLKSAQSEFFLHDILLPRFRNGVQTEKKINYHVYRALKKALYKPAAFFKGFLFPLAEGSAEGGPCTLREAVIVGSVLARVSIPALHSSAALLRLTEMEEDFSGPISLFIKVLVEKKYALPYRVLDSCVFHFLRFRSYDNSRKPLPVVWHQSLLVFAQRYKNDITEDQRDALLDVAKLQIHPSITPEIRRELVQAVSRDGMQVDQ